MTALIKRIDNVLDGITMYRLALYVLTGLVAVAVLFGALGILPYAPSAILLSLTLAVVVCWMVNQFFVWMLKAAASVESVYITAFILALILPPAKIGDVSAALTIVVASVAAMASKYIFVYRKKHLFNPAALGVAVTGIAMGAYASWWVAGNLALLPFVLVGGLALVRKLHRFDMVLTFIIVALLAMVLIPSAAHPVALLQLGLLHTSLLFFAFVMLTEPLTTPPKKNYRRIYAALAGILFAPAVTSSPELALLIANLFSFSVSPKGRHLLTLLRIENTSASTKDLVFAPEKPLTFSAGQYLEWTLPHTKPDDRGDRRYFTIASSPTEQEVRLGVKFFEKGSSFKKELRALQIGDTIAASQLSGGFVLPQDKQIKLVFIAGGIGITPFRSMVRYMLDTNDVRSTVLFYANKNAFDVAYRELWSAAKEKMGMKTVYVFNDHGVAEGFPDAISMLDATIIKKEVSDYQNRLFYLSGPRAMITAFQTILRTMHVPDSHIKTDFFPGFA